MKKVKILSSGIEAGFVSEADGKITVEMPGGEQKTFLKEVDGHPTVAIIEDEAAPREETLEAAWEAAGLPDVPGMSDEAKRTILAKLKKKAPTAPRTVKIGSMGKGEFREANEQEIALCEAISLLGGLGSIYKAREKTVVENFADLLETIKERAAAIVSATEISYPVEDPGSADDFE